MRKQVLKKTFCFLLVMSLLVGTFITTAQATVSTNELRDLLVDVLERGSDPVSGPEMKAKFILLLNKIDSSVKDQKPIDYTSLAQEAQKIVGVNKSIDSYEAALKKYANYKDPSGQDNKGYIKGLIAVFSIKQYSYPTTGFSDIAEKINKVVTDDPKDYRGLRLVVTLLDELCTYTSDRVVFDLNNDTKLIDINVSGHATAKDMFASLISILGIYQDKIQQQNAKTPAEVFEVFASETENYINTNCKGKQVEEFKKYLISANPLIYKGDVTLPSSTPTPIPSASATSGQPSSVVNTPLPSTNTVTSTATATTTATPTTKPTVTPTALPSDKKITSFSFKGLNPEVKGVIYEQVHTIFVKVPFGTDIKDLEPTIEFQGVSVQPDSGKKRNFSHPQFYTVTAQDKSKARYVVVVYFGLDTILEEPKPVVPGAGPYGDAYNHWAENQILSLVEQGLVTGYPDGSVKPDAQMTRAEVVTLLVKGLGLAPAEKPKLDFKDAKDIPAWAQGYVQVAVEKGFVTGYDDKTFKASNKVTRQELAVMAMKAFGFAELKDKVLSFKDVKDIAPWAKGYIAKAVENEIIKGYEDNTFRPKNEVTRAEVFAIIDRCLSKKA